MKHPNSVCRALALGAFMLAGGLRTAAAGDDIVLYARNASTVAGAWSSVSDSTAAGGARMANPDAGAAKLSAPLASPSSYFDVKFTPKTGVAYHLWIRGKAQNNSWTNDSVFVQFSGSSTSSGSAVFRIGTTSATVYSLEPYAGAGESGWGWQDNGYDSVGTPIYFNSTSQTIRIQVREDGLSIDQIVLSPVTYATTAPGAAKNDTKILPENTGSATSTTTTTTTTTTTSTSTTLRVLQWNTHHGGYGTDGVYSPSRLATWAASFKPDVVMFNEIEKYTSWGNQDQPEVYKSLLQQKTGKTWYYAFAQEFGNWSSNGKGNLILSTYPISIVDRYELVHNADRSIAMAQITVNNRDITLVLTHLDPYDATLRLTQAKEVTGWSAVQPENRIITGDMNAWPDQTSIAHYDSLYYDSWAVAVSKGTAKAFSGNNGETKNGRIDYIFYSKYSTSLGVVSSQVYDTRDANGVMPSDHRPVLTVFSVK